MKIEVTLHDIINGTPKNGQFCAVACAIRRQVPGARLNTVYVNPVAACVVGGVYPLPAKVKRFVKKFDRAGAETRRRMKPFAFELPIGDNRE